MKVTETKLKGCFIVEPKVHEDQRGYFFESFNLKEFQSLTGSNTEFVQDNQSKSRYGVLRGLHFQRGIHAQAKLVRVIRGEVLDIAVDIRKGSNTFGEHVAIKLSEANKKQFFVPRGFAHGFIVLSDYCEFFYKCDNYYNKDSESGIHFNDADLNIDWIIEERDIIVSEKDQLLKSFKDIKL